MSTKNTKTSIGTKPKPKPKNVQNPVPKSKSEQELWTNISKSSDFDQFWENIVNDCTKGIELSSEGKELLQKISNLDLPDSDDQD